jgi:ankyrin repeat protein
MQPCISLKSYTALTENPDLDFIAHAQDIDSNSILHLASLTNNLEIAEPILEHGASVNASTCNLSTPLHLACSKGHVQMVKLLIVKEADIEARDNDGRAPLHMYV